MINDEKTQLFLRIFLSPVCHFSVYMPCQDCGNSWTADGRYGFLLKSPTFRRFFGPAAGLRTPARPAGGYLFLKKHVNSY
jgi:hypothetical protein